MQQSIPKIILNLSPSPSASVAITLELQKIIQFCKKFQYSEELLYPEKQKSKFRPFFRIYTVPPPPPLPLKGVLHVHFTLLRLTTCFDSSIFEKADDGYASPVLLVWAHPFALFIHKVFIYCANS